MSVRVAPFTFYEKVFVRETNTTHIGQALRFSRSRLSCSSWLQFG